MARFGIFSGILLCIDTALALFGSLSKPPVLFIPMMCGIPILFFGVVALNPHRRRQALGTAALIGGLGCLVGFGHLLHFCRVWLQQGIVNLHYMRIVGMMVAICVIFCTSYLVAAFRGGRQRLARRRSGTSADVRVSD
ncbi:MAG: hypothetical protein AAFV88_11465 [Planctomycetota bacterium]